MHTRRLGEGPKILGESGNDEGKGDRGRQPPNKTPQVCRSTSKHATPHGLAQGTKREGGTDQFGRRGTFFKGDLISQ